MCLRGVTGAAHLVAGGRLHRYLTRIPPSGDPILAAAIRAVREPEIVTALREQIQRRLGAAAVTLHCSGREALRVALRELAARTGRSEVIVPAYTCFSVPAAAVAAGLRVRLVDVDLAGRIEAAALRGLPLERAVAVLVSNLFGIPEPVSEILALARGQGTGVIDDAAQAFGARSPEGPVGGRGELGILSFGRGKPLAAAAGGAVAWVGRPREARDDSPKPQPARALLRAAGHDLALQPWVFRWLAAMPAFRIGESIYDPAFRRGGIDGASTCLAAALLPSLDLRNRERAERALEMTRRIEAESPFRGLVAPRGWTAVYPRLALLAPSEKARDAAAGALRSLGATRMYPTPLDRIPALQAHLAGSQPCSGAHELSSRLLTLPTHGRLGERYLERIVRVLGRVE